MIAVPACGAHLAMSSNYNRLPRPAVVHVLVYRRRGRRAPDLEDLVTRSVPERLARRGPLDRAGRSGNDVIVINTEPT